MDGAYFPIHHPLSIETPSPVTAANQRPPWQEIKVLEAAISVVIFHRSDRSTVAPRKNH